MVCRGSQRNIWLMNQTSLVEGLKMPGLSIPAALTKRVQNIFPDAQRTVNQCNSGVKIQR